MCCSGLRGSLSRSPPRHGRGALGVTWQPGRGVPPRSPGDDRLFFWKVCQPKSPLSGRADCCSWPLLAPPTPAGCSGGDRSGFAALWALDGGRRGERAPGSLPQVKAQAALLVTTPGSFSGSSLLSAGAAREPPGDGTSAAHSGTFTLLPTLPSSAREKTSTHLLVTRQVTRETRIPGQREEEEKEEEKKKSRRRPPLPQVQVGTLRFRPPGDEIGPGRIRGASLGVSDWRRAVPRRLRIRLLGETVERPGGLETRAVGGLPWRDVT